MNAWLFNGIMVVLAVLFVVMIWCLKEAYVDIFTEFIRRSLR